MNGHRPRSSSVPVDGEKITHLKSYKRLRNGGGFIVMFAATTIALAQPLRVEPGGRTPIGDQQKLTPAQIMDIPYATGLKMHAAGFDRAENVRSLSDKSSQYLRDSDTVMINPDDEDVQDETLRQQYFSVPAADRFAAIAAHEHCHAFLIKHRNHLLPAVQAAEEACLVFPDVPGGRAFDEPFCDVAAIISLVCIGRRTQGASIPPCR